MIKKDNVIIFKGKKDSILILLDSEVSFEELKQALREKAEDANKFFDGAKTGITFNGRSLTEEEELELLSIIKDQTNLSVSFAENAHEQDMQLMKVRRETRISKPFDSSEHMAVFHQGSLRNGQSIRYAGSVVIVGDVNPGAEIIAEGNIIILGAVKGLVHAGCMGNTECFIFAFNLSPTQLRIADIATYIPDEMIKRNKKKPAPSYAYIQEGQIYIAPMM